MSAYWTAAVAIAGWCAISFFVAVASRWQALSRRFQARSRPAGTSLTGQVFSVGPVPERRVTRLIVGAEGLFLARAWPFRFGHPPLLIPWGEVRAKDPGEVGDIRSLALGESATICVTEGALNAMRPYLDAARA
jgi:hypothetical protein